MSEIYSPQIISTAASFRFILEELQTLVVQVEARVACEVQLLELRRKRLWQSHLSQLVAAQVDTLRRRQRLSSLGLFSLISIQGTTIKIQHNSRWILINLRRELLIFISNFPN